MGLLLSALITTSVSANNSALLVQSTTSTANSGLYKYLLPVFEKQTGIQVNVVAVGTGQAIRNAKNCDADVLLVHAKQAEEAFVTDGYGVERFDLMYNDFIVIGPNDNPANIQPGDSAATALGKIISSESLFASRGDDSGTHKKELTLWQAASPGADIENSSWYRSTGSGMGATINTAIGLGAYTLTDRATWISFNNKQDFAVVVEGDENLFNQYGVIMVNPEKCPSVSQQNARQFIDWLLSSNTQQLIGKFTVHGEQLFYPNAK